MPSSRIVMLVYVAYWVFFLVVVWRLEKKIGELERENSELKGLNYRKKEKEVRRRNDFERVE